MDSVAALCDGLRRPLLRGLLRLELARRIFVDPKRRIPLSGLAAVGIAAVLALCAPLVSLWLGAALFGVPHVVSGMRHVAVRGRVEPVTRVCSWLGIAVGATQVAGAGTWAVRAFVILFAIAVAAELRADPSSWRRAALFVVTAAAAAAGLAQPALFLLAVAHLHALSSLGWFAVRARRRGVAVWPVVLPAVLILAGGLLGAFDGLFPAALWAPRSATSSIVAEAIGSSVMHPSALGLRRALFLYAFGQSLHFAVWLRLVPDVDRPGPVPHSFRRAFALLRHDLGRLALPAVALCALAIPLIFFGGGAARETYFALTYFHIGLEAAALARCAARAAPRSLQDPVAESAQGRGSTSPRSR